MFVSYLVLKLGLVRFATSLLVVLLANVLNRVMILDLSVPATLVTFSFAFQHVMTPVGLISGYFSDAYSLAGRRRVHYIWGGMLLSVAVMPLFPFWALSLASDHHSRSLLYQGMLLFSLFGIGTTVSATAVNALLVDQIAEKDRGSALTMVWILTLLGVISGSALTSFLFPAYDPWEIKKVFGIIALLVLLITLLGTWGVEPRNDSAPSGDLNRVRLWPTIKFLASDGQTIGFFLFLGASVFFLSIQAFLLTPFGGEVLALPLDQTTKFGIYITYGVLLGMTGVHLLLSVKKSRGTKVVLVASLIVGALAFCMLSLTSFRPNPVWGVYTLYFLGLAKGLYNVGLSHLTMSLAPPAFSGTFMGLWNLASGIALAAGEMAGGALKDQIFYFSGTSQGAYGWVFLLEGVGFLACLLLLVPLKMAKYHRKPAVLQNQTDPPYELGKIAEAAQKSNEAR